MTTKAAINAWSGQDARGFTQAWRIDGPGTITDISRLPDYGRIKAGYLQGQQPASAAFQVAALALPGVMIELEATAAL